MNKESSGGKFDWKKALIETNIKYVVFAVLGIYALYRNLGISFFSDSDGSTSGSGSGSEGAQSSGPISGKMDAESEAYINDRMTQLGILTLVLFVVLVWLRYVNSKYENFGMARYLNSKYEVDEINEQEREREEARKEAGLTKVLGKEEFDDLDPKKNKQKKESEIKSSKKKTE
eukprot:CAMPEP_0176461106 /NCGR_PEP_ID=MMETSP0127-20121128/34446_1 /TAXON_ID=938130 /ORGANISM="Platyophrya macrostoma, Strain WH" /LENGTH=173 /DNA_ID=CAMNT_0017852713 /DNA_START=42 /DNA_END=564 /DNA_ORIENTATION=+